jgi:replicative DNA helicase
LSDLRESGECEQVADTVAFLHKEDDKAQDPDTVPMILIVAKQRNGPTGDVHLVFRKKLTLFESASKVGPVDEAGPARLPYHDV